MLLTSVRAVHIDIPRTPPKSAPRREPWPRYVPRAMPINHYAEFSRLPQDMPGAGLPEVWVQANAADGTTGYGRCSFGQPVASYIDHVIAPLIEGRDCMAIELMNDLIVRAGHRHGIAGLVATALSGVDIALWDLKGKLLGRPVYELLGGPVRDHIELYATNDHLDWSQELGFTRFKITNPAHYSEGDEGLKRIEEHVALARDTVGPEAELMINPVMSFNVEFTLRLAERLRPYNLRWLEEPLPPHDIEGHTELKRSVTWIPLATGEDHRGRYEFAKLIEKRAVDIVQPDISWGGGLSETMKVYTIASTAGILTIPHGGANTPWGQHFAMAAPESPYQEFWLGTAPGIPLEEVVPIPGMAMPINGKIKPSDSPGFGMEIQDDWVRPWHYTTKLC